ncbi:Txe/YoeB family addiction module toxin [Limosilactobacillus caccae]|uniref:Txe/YoeB family addiction module toxin n=1 Tax=Limosilactobacillus caccae TaxID=1926284 RepID=UPI003F6369B0
MIGCQLTIRLNIDFTQDAWYEYLDWKKNDKKMVKRIDKIINDTIHHPFTGIGKPEPLQHNLTGFWSRKIDSEHRMVYDVTREEIQIIQLKYYYDK